MKKRYLLGLSIISAAFIGCGGGGSSSSSSTDVLVEDGLIIGAKVTDSAGHVATYKDGHYTFNTKAKLPIKVVTQNTIKDGNVSGEVKTFQDLNKNGKYDDGDVAYNAAMSIDYSASSSDVKANPVTALIPSNWDGESEIAGLSADKVKLASTKGLDASNDKTLKLTAAKLTAIQETFVKYGLKPEESDKVLEKIPADKDIVKNFDDVVKSVAQDLVDDTTLFNDDTKNLTDVSTAVSNVATSINDLSTNTDLSSPETLVAVVQTLPEDATEVANDTNPITTDDLAQVDNSVFKNLVESLELIPLSVIDPDDETIAKMDVLKVKNFKIEYIDDTHIKVVATATDLDDKYSFVINQTYTKDNAGAFVYKKDDNHIAKIIFDYEGGRYLVIKVDDTNIPYPLLTTDEIKNNQKLMDNKDSINSRNEAQL